MKSRMKYGLIIVLFLILSSFNLFSQNRFGNEWINYSNSYYAIPVAENGIYKVTYEDLAAAGVPISTIPPSQLQLWHRGEQVAFQTVNANTSSFTLGDYLLFYGIKNDGWQDTSLYTSPSLQPHKLLSLFSDTTTFYLTWSTGFSKRAITSGVFPTGTFESKHSAEIINLHFEDYSDGSGSSVDPQNSFWTSAEGWCSGGNSSFLENFTLSSSLTGSYNVSGVVLARNSSGNGVQISSNGNNIGLVNYGGNASAGFSFGITQSSIVSSLAFNLTGQNSANSFSIGYLKLSYPQSFDMGFDNTRTFLLDPNSNNISNIKISNAPSGATILDITDYKNIVAISGYVTGPNELAFSVPNTSIQRKILVVGNLKKPSKISPINFKQYSTTPKTFVILTHPFLMRSVGSSINPIKDYANYRYSAAGGSYDTLTVDVTQLYHQFGYGEKTPLAVRKFCDFIIQAPSQKPSFLFIIGKGMDGLERNARFNPSALKLPNLMPTYGPPGSDFLFSTNLGGSQLNEPAIPTGRICASTPDEVIYYLNKIKIFESTPFDLWRKNMVHLSGGAPDIGTINSITSFMTSFENIAKGPLLGAKVINFQKRSDAVYQLFDLSKELKEGLLVINAFGHAAATVTELDIGFPSKPELNYPENGQYPLVIINGCDAGSAFSDTRSIGEDWTLTPNKGAIAVMAHVHLGYVHSLGAYGQIFYGLAFSDTSYFSKPLGEIHRETIKRFYGNGVGDSYYSAQSQQFLLQGDPAVVLFGPLKPDYTTSDAQVFINSFSNNPVEAETDSFSVGVVVSNLARGVNDSLGICLQRTLPDGTIINYPTQLFKPILNKDTVYFKVIYKGEESFGINTFAVMLNCGNKIPELNFSNNSGSIQYFMSKKSVLCLTPPEFSIVSNQPVQFVAQTTNQLSNDNRQFFYEIDTSAKFTSPVKLSGTINGNALAEWKTNLLSDVTANDSTVYYWRVRSSDVTPNNAIVWTNSSFLYIKNSPSGWSQSKFDQFYKITNQGVVKDTINRKWAFQNSSFKLKITTEGAKVFSSGVNTTISMNDNIIINNTAVQCSDFGYAGIHGFAIDQFSFNLYQIFNTVASGLDNDNIRRFQCRVGSVSATLVNKFNANSSGWNNVLPSFNHGDLLKKIKDLKYGDYVVLYSVNDAQFGNTNVWSSDFIALFESFGAKNISKLKPGWPYILVARKGIPGAAIEILPDSNNAFLPPNQQLITLDAVVPVNTNQGAIISPEFGPASAWANLLYKTTGNDAGAQDFFSLQILGKTATNSDTILYSGIPANGMDVSWINATKYSKLRLKAFFKDTINVTPLQLKKWQLLYSPVPEGSLVINNSQNNTYQSIDKFAGDTLAIPFYFKNISNVAFKNPLVVDYTVYLGNQKITRKDSLKSELKPDSIWALPKFKIATNGLSGKNNFQIYVNPRLQPEQYYPNNFYSSFFNVQKDTKNPVLDVAFDGVRIMNGDIVSPSPVITINVNDENPYLLKKDTVGIELLIKNCQEQSCNFERISLMSSEVTYAPANNSRNKFQITYHPKNLPDGTYTLRMQAEDASGNRAGVQPYQINFEVVNQSAMTYFFPYPNPFSTHTRFAYTLTGTQVPDELKIQIITVSGRIVREILQNELGALKVGTHLTDYVWDGTDEFGDKLANGVYFYKVFARANGKDLDKRSTAADKAFTESYGKLYIMR